MHLSLQLGLSQTILKAACVCNCVVLFRIIFDTAYKKLIVNRERRQQADSHQIQGALLTANRKYILGLGLLSVLLISDEILKYKDENIWLMYINEMELLSISQERDLYKKNTQVSC